MSASQFDPAASKSEAIDKILAHPGYGGLGVQAYGDWVILWLQGPDESNGAPMVWTGLDPKTAMQFGENLARAGHAAESKEDVYGKTPIVIEQIRQRLVVTITHLLRGDMERGVDPEMMAQRAVELMLKEAA